MVKHNNILPNAHFHKDWDKNVRMWFNQPGRKKRRRMQRKRKASSISPKPSDGRIRPVVRCPTQRYNMRKRLGKGFSLDELKGAGITPRKAQTIGIAIDHRRRNISEEGLQENVQRLNTYLSKLVVFPRKSNKPRKGDSPAGELEAAKQLTGTILPIIKEETELETRVIDPAEMEKSAYQQLRRARHQGKLLGKKRKSKKIKKK